MTFKRRLSQPLILHTPGLVSRVARSTHENGFDDKESFPSINLLIEQGKLPCKNTKISASDLIATNANHGMMMMMMMTTQKFPKLPQIQSRSGLQVKRASGLDSLHYLPGENGALVAEGHLISRGETKKAFLDRLKNVTFLSTWELWVDGLEHLKSLLFFFFFFLS